MSNTPTPIPTSAEFLELLDLNPEWNYCNKIAREAIAALAQHEREQASRIQPCGHDISQIVSGGEGTNHCGQCQHEQTIREQAEKIAKLHGVIKDLRTLRIAELERKLHYIEHEGWDCQSKLKASVVAACDALGIPHHEHYKIVSELDQLRQRVKELHKAADWFAENAPGTPVPEWVDEAMNNDSAQVGMKSVDQKEHQP